MSNNTGKWKIFIGPAVTLILVLGSFIAQYATIRADVKDVEEDLVKVEQKLEKAEKKVQDLEVKTAVGDNVLNTLTNDVAVIKADVKKLLGE